MTAKAPIIQTVKLTAGFGDRLLFRELTLDLGYDRVVLIGRNGVGKSTLLSLLSGESRPKHGTVTQRGDVCLVPQLLSLGPQSPGERRKEHLEQACSSGADLLLLDEPTQDLDDSTVGWLRAWLADWDRGLMVATHDRRLLKDFQHFFVMAESGCRYLSGTFEHLENELEKEFQAQEVRYLKRLNHLTKIEEHTLQSARRRKRKQQYGRVREIDRATSRARLNQKRDQAQVSHGRINSLREERMDEVRDWTRSARRSLKVDLPLELQMPNLSTTSTGPSVVAQGLSSMRGERCLFRDFDLELGRERIAVTGPNGAGKTTLLKVLCGDLKPDAGTVWVDPSRLGVVEQGGANWRLDISLIDYLARTKDPEEVGQSLVAQKSFGTRRTSASNSKPGRTGSSGVAGDSFPQPAGGSSNP